MNPFQGMALPTRVVHRITSHAQRMHAASHGAAERIVAAQAKRDRRNAKRAEDAALSDQGQVWARLRKFDKAAA